MLHRRTGKMIEAQTLDIGPGGMRVNTNRPLARRRDARVRAARPRRASTAAPACCASSGYRVYALRFEKLGDEARAEIAELLATRRGA